jgi:hypothetical protein
MFVRFSLAGFIFLASSMPRPATGGVLYSPGVVNIDMSIVKTFRITEKVAFNFRFEAFNLFNTPYFGFPNANIGSPTVGRITSTVGDNRSLQLSGRINF